MESYGAQVNGYTIACKCLNDTKYMHIVNMYIQYALSPPRSLTRTVEHQMATPRIICPQTIYRHNEDVHIL